MHHKKSHFITSDKCSAVAKTGDHFATINMGHGLWTQTVLPAPVNPESYLGAAVTLSVGELGPHLTQCGMGRGLPPHQVAP